jgi:hypothetical protein
MSQQGTMQDKEVRPFLLGCVRLRGGAVHRAVMQLFCDADRLQVSMLAYPQSPVCGKIWDSVAQHEHFPPRMEAAPSSSKAGQKEPATQTH